MTNDELISRDEVLAGLPAKRANTLLFLIESQTAHLVARSRVEFSLSGSVANERALAFLEAFALGNAPPLHPTIQHLERYALQWSPLVPENPRLRVALIRTISQKYNFTYQTIPNIRTALGLDNQVVQQIYLNQYRKPLNTVFASRLSLVEQMHWIGAAITQGVESLPPFWIAALITVALGLPQAFLALPIAAAQVGPLATLVFLLILGIVNILTMACMAEAMSRSGDFRYGNAFIKQLAANYLGDAGSFILSVSVSIRVFFIALASYIGLSATMASLTPIPAQLWAAFLFAAGLYLLSQKYLNFTVTVMVLLAAINIGLLLILALLAFRHWQLDNLLYVNLPFFSRRSFDLQVLHQVFGVILMLYFGHIYVGECAKVVLPRDPSAASLIWGNMAGTAFLTLLFCLWVLAINGAISPQMLVSQSGTAIEPLAQQIGPIVKVLGAVLVTLLLGMAWIRSSSLLINLTREWFPRQPQSILMLPCQQGRLILRPPDNSSYSPHIGLTYLGLRDNQPKFRIDVQSGGNLQCVEIGVDKHSDIKELLPQFTDLNQLGIDLKLEILSVNHDYVSLKISSSMILIYEGGLEQINNVVGHQQHQRKFWGYWLKQRHFLLSISPLLLILLLTEWFLFANTQSFVNVLGFAGVLGNSLVGGIFPVLMLASSRRKGEIVPSVPSLVLRLLNRPWLLAGIYSLFLAMLLLHGLFIWKNPVARTSAIGVAVLSLATTLFMQKTGAFTPRTVVEVREEQGVGGRTIFNITACGKPKIVEVCLGYAEGEQHLLASTFEISSSLLHYATFKLLNEQIKELRVWAHRSKPNGDFESLPVIIEIYGGNKIMQFDLKLSGGTVLLPFISDLYSLKMILPKFRASTS